MWRLSHLRLEAMVNNCCRIDSLYYSVREGRRTDATSPQPRHHPHLLDPTFSLSSSFIKIFVLPASTFRGPKKDLLSSPGDMNLISPIPVTTAQHKNTSKYLHWDLMRSTNLPLSTCTLIDRCIVSHTKAKETSLSYHNTIIYAEPILFLSKVA